MSIPVKPLKVETLISEELEGLDEIVYVDTANDSSVSLNMTAVAVLDLCDGKRSPEDIAAVICDVSEAEKPQVMEDVRGILEQFTELGLIYSD